MAKKAKKAAVRRPKAPAKAKSTRSPRAGGSAARSPRRAADAAREKGRVTSPTNPTAVVTSKDIGQEQSNASQLPGAADATSAPQQLPAIPGADERFLNRQHLHGDTNKLGKIPGSRDRE